MNLVFFITAVSVFLFIFLTVASYALGLSAENKLLKQALRAKHDALQDARRLLDQERENAQSHCDAGISFMEERDETRKERDAYKVLLIRLVNGVERGCLWRPTDDVIVAARALTKEWGHTVANTDKE